MPSPSNMSPGWRIRSLAAQAPCRSGRAYRPSGRARESGNPGSLRGFSPGTAPCSARSSSTIAEVSDPERRRGPMTTSTAVAVPSISPRNGERPVLDVPAAKMLDGFPRRVLASRLAPRCLSQQFLGLHRTFPIRPDLVWVPAPSDPVSDQLRAGVGPPADPIGGRRVGPSSGWIWPGGPPAGRAVPRRFASSRRRRSPPGPGHQGTAWGSP
jgi:hypothetical protein